MESYQELEVWQKAINLVTEIYKTTRTFPKEKIYALSSQTQRAAISIPANIAEGWGRNMTKEYIQFLRIARGSLLEVETHMIISKNLNYVNEQILESILQKTKQINKMINSLIKSLTKK